MIKSVLLVLTLVSHSLSSQAQDCSTHGVQQASPRDVAGSAVLPQVGKWMIDSEGNVAHWLGDTLNGLTIDEPINTIFELHATTAAEATQKFFKTLARAGYAATSGHSSGYHAILGSQVWSQLPAQDGFAFANGPADTETNHGRAFGPLAANGEFFFIAAFSRENPDFLCQVFCPSYSWHKYVSFTQAREAVAHALVTKAGANLRGYANLASEIACSSKETTGDHDGRAAVLEF